MKTKTPTPLAAATAAGLLIGCITVSGQQPGLQVAQDPITYGNVDGFRYPEGYSYKYDYRSYNTPSGYINPNYTIPTKNDIDTGEKVDEAMQTYILDGGKSMEDMLKKFEAERYDVFWEMDQVADPNTGELHPLSLDVRAVMGRNTWIMWCGGNEWFWDYLATDGVGLLDYLHLLDSRNRHRRFSDNGICNQPGMSSNPDPGPWGLFLDKLDEPLNHRGEKFEFDYPPLGDGKHEIVSDGVDPEVYGYPSGVIGFRLFPNPNFDDEAAAKWDPKAFYTDRSYRSNPDLERPLRVGMSCALCHVAAHPLNPPANPEEPDWENLSAIIGNQYFRTSAVLGSQTYPTNFLYQFLSSQQPGTVDTSMTSTDWISNSNAMNAVFELQARIHRSLRNPPEEQPPGALNLAVPFNEGKNPRRFPRVLMEGADSIGAWGALARVYLNIGLFGEQWNNVQNTVIGATPRRPFSIDTCHTNSVNWNVNEAYRVHYTALYFNHRLVKDQGGETVLMTPDKVDQLYDPTHTFVESSTQAMHLENALVNGRRFADQPDLVRQHIPPDKVAAGRKVFTQNCMLCHSSRQPEGYGLAFEHEAPGGKGWENTPAVEAGTKLVLPYAHEHWDAFKKSPSYAAYAKKASELADADEDFFTDENFLSNEVRIPVSLVATNSQRALAENALEGEVWNDYSSSTYKNLKPVGKISYYNAINGKNESYQPKGNGRGYFRPATLVSVWATAPLFHGNTLGHYIPDHLAPHRVSVAGRLEMFDDAIGKLLWKDKRGLTPSGEGGLRNSGDTTWRGSDPGWIFRTNQRSDFKIDALQIRGVVERFLAHRGLSPILFIVDQPWFLPLLLAVVVGLLAWKARRWNAYLAIIAGVVVILALWITGLVHVLPKWSILLGLLLLAAGVLATAGIQYAKKNQESKDDAGSSDKKATILTSPWTNWSATVTLFLLSIVLFGALSAAKLLVNGGAGDFKLGPFPKGMPVSSFMNMNTDASIPVQLGALRGLFHAFGVIKGDNLHGEEALAAYNKYAGPGLMKASKVPDWVIDRGHYFGESLTDAEKDQLIAFLKTL